MGYTVGNVSLVMGDGHARPHDLPSCLPCSARGLEKAQQQLQDEIRQVNAQLLEERKKRETHEALARRLQKRNALLTKVQPPAWLSSPMPTSPCSFGLLSLLPIFMQPSGKLHMLACGP